MDCFIWSLNSDWTPQASHTGLGIGSSLKQIISCAGGVAAHVVLTKYGWVKTLQSDLRSTLEWKAAFLNWCESGPWHNTLTPIQQGFYSGGWLLKVFSLQIQLNDTLITGYTVPCSACRFTSSNLNTVAVWVTGSLTTTGAISWVSLSDFVHAETSLHVQMNMQAYSLGSLKHSLQSVH